MTLANTISWSERPGMIDTLPTMVAFVLKKKSKMFDPKLARPQSAQADSRSVPQGTPCKRLDGHSLVTV